MQIKRCQRGACLTLLGCQELGSSLSHGLVQGCEEEAAAPHPKMTLSYLPCSLKKHCWAWKKEWTHTFLRVSHGAGLGPLQAPGSPIQSFHRCQSGFWKCKLNPLSEHFQGLGQQTMAHGPNPDAPVFVNKVLLEHNHAHSSACGQGLPLLYFKGVE